MTDLINFKTKQPEVQEEEVPSFEGIEDSARMSETPWPFKGLCINCSKRHSCELAKSEAGIWKCQDYDVPWP